MRFGLWEEILAAPLVPPQCKALSHEPDFCVTVATARYARAVALAALRRPAEAEAEAARLEAALAAVPESRCLFNNTHVFHHACSHPGRLLETVDSNL